MKYFLVLILTIIICSFVFSQSNVDKLLTWETFYRDSLTVDKDTISIKFADYNASQFDSYTVTVQSSSSDDDTLYMYTQTADTLDWVPSGVVGLTTGTYGTYIITSQTWTEYLLTDPQPKKIRITRASDDASIPRIYITGKRESQ